MPTFNSCGGSELFKDYLGLDVKEAEADCKYRCSSFNPDCISHIENEIKDLPDTALQKLMFLNEDYLSSHSAAQLRELAAEEWERRNG